MTREIIRQIERDYWAEKADPIDMSEIFDLAQKALEQEPKSEWEQDHEILKAHSDGANEVLDKIRAEIENDWQLKKYPSSPFSCGLRRAIEIIDKYKAESDIEKLKPCINYEDGCEEWAGCPCVYYKAESENP